MVSCAGVASRRIGMLRNVPKNVPAEERNHTNPSPAGQDRPLKPLVNYLILLGFFVLVWPVTPEVAGSSPVGPAKRKATQSGGFSA
jgi:hypothetical protein